MCIRDRPCGKIAAVKSVHTPVSADEGFLREVFGVKIIFGKGEANRKYQMFILRNQISKILQVDCRTPPLPFYKYKTMQFWKTLQHFINFFILHIATCLLYTSCSPGLEMKKRRAFGVFLYSVFQCCMLVLDLQDFGRHIKALSLKSSKLVVNSAWNPAYMPVNQGFFEIINHFISIV